MENERLDRQLLFLGKKGQKAIGQTKVGVIGLGGLGSQVVQALAYLGVLSFVLIDPELVEKTNLNRLIGATVEDALAATPKVQIARRLILSINSDIRVDDHCVNLRSTEALDALRSCALIFGCVDNDAARLVLSELSAAYLIPLIDSATEIITDSVPGIFGGRVIVTEPGKYCLSCADAIDMEIAKQELESIEAREMRLAHGYGLGEQEPSPSVVSLNGIIANLAITEFMMLATGLREPNRYIHYHGARSLKDGAIITNRIPNSDPDCFTCKYLAGKGDRANIYRYVLPEKRDMDHL